MRAASGFLCLVLIAGCTSSSSQPAGDAGALADAAAQPDGKAADAAAVPDGQGGDAKPDGQDPLLARCEAVNYKLGQCGVNHRLGCAHLLQLAGGAEPFESYLACFEAEPCAVITSTLTDVRAIPGAAFLHCITFNQPGVSPDSMTRCAALEGKACHAELVACEQGAACKPWLACHLSCTRTGRAEELGLISGDSIKCHSLCDEKYPTRGSLANAVYTCGCTQSPCLAHLGIKGVHDDPANGVVAHCDDSP